MKVLGDNAYSVWLYGSHARGDPDNLSDIDIFVAGSVPDERAIEVRPFEDRTLSISQYDWHEVQAMASYGSLFLHHLRLEGRPLNDHAEGTSRVIRLLEHLPKYKLFRRDMKAFHLTVNDIRDGIGMGSTPEFELAVLATVLRHSSVLGCYMLGHPCFGRTEPIRKAASALGFAPENVNAFITLYLFRVHEDGRCEMPFKPSRDQVFEYCDQAEILLNQLDEVADAFSRGLPEANC